MRSRPHPKVGAIDKRDQPPIKESRKVLGKIEDVDGRVSAVEDSHYLRISSSHWPARFTRDRQPVLAVVRSEANGCVLVPRQEGWP
jgi:hypothetical protein